MSIKLKVSTLPSEELLLPGIIYVQSKLDNSKLDSSKLTGFVRVRSTDPLVRAVSGVYRIISHDKVSGVALSKTQREYLLVKEGEELWLETVDVSTLPLIDCVLRVTSGRELLTGGAELTLSNISSILNLGEMLMFKVAGDTQTSSLTSSQIGNQSTANNNKGGKFVYARLVASGNGVSVHGALTEPTSSSASISLTKEAVRVRSLSVAVNPDNADRDSTASRFVVNPSPLPSLPTVSSSSTNHNNHNNQSDNNHDDSNNYTISLNPTTNSLTGFSFQPVDFEKLGVGGLSQQFETIFRRIFMPRLLADKGKSYNVKPAKGLLLYGPAGTGKTASARALASLLGGKDDQQKGGQQKAVVSVINASELNDKMVGGTEKNIRDLFAPAAKNPDKLHIFIFDEIDAIARRRGASGRDHADVALNQLLTMIDGFTVASNIVVIGITNRKDVLDEAITRPGRLEVQVYIGLPNQKGREEIFTIHAKDLIDNQHLQASIIPALAARMANFSGAEIEAVIKNTKTLVLRRHIDINNIEESVAKLPNDLQFTAEDFTLAMSEIQPAFGSRYYAVPSPLLEHQQPAYQALSAELESTLLLDRTKNLLVHGGSKTGKTVLAKHVLNDFACEYKYYLGGREILGDTREKVELLRRVFTTDTKNGLIVIDNVEILLAISYNYYDHQVLQTLLLLLNEHSHNVIILGSKLEQLEQLSVIDEIDTSFQLSRSTQLSQ